MTNETILKKAGEFKSINELCLKGENVIFGSTYMADFPFYELINKSQLSSAVYNRSIRGLTITDAHTVLGECVFSMKPGKVFFALGDEDRLCDETAEAYLQLIRKVHDRLPSTKLYLILLPFLFSNQETVSSISAFGAKMTSASNYLSTIQLTHSSFKDQFLELVRFFRNTPITLTEAFAITSL